MKDDDKPIVNPFVVLREEFDDWAVLFNPDTRHGFGLNPTGVFVCKLLDGEHTMDDLLQDIHHHADNVPEGAGVHIGAFVDALVAEGLAGFDPNPVDGITLRPETCASPTPGALGEAKTFNYEPPRLVNLSSGHTTVKNGDKPIVNPHVVLREEFDDWAVLFNPDAVLGFAGFGLNPTGVYLWKLLDGERTIDGLLEELRQHADNVPGGAGDHIGAFIDALVTAGLAGYGDGSCRKKCSPTPLGALNEVTPFTYEPPKLVNLSSAAQVAHGSCGNGSHPSGSCGSGTTACGCSSGGGNTAGPCCESGCSATYYSCCYGDCDTSYCGGGSGNDSCGCGNCVGQSCCCGSCVDYSFCGYCWCGGCPEENSCDTFGSRPNC